MKILHELCSVPTAPFAEQRVIDFVERFVAKRRNLKLARDRFGNLLIEFRRAARSARTPRLVFVAHMDHPGFVARRMRDKRTLEANFYGGVLSEYVVGTRVRFFDATREISGVVQSVVPDEERAAFPSAAVVRVSAPVSAGSAGMFDQGEARIKRGKLYSRVCDDLAGAASALTLLEALHRRRTGSANVAVLLTRAEEDGFIGAIASVLHPALLKKTDLVVSIECSAMQPYAKQGDGVILRVGDRTSVFNSALTYFLAQQAESLAKRDKTFKFQRSLMPGGTCEATVFDAYGYTAGAVCVPLGNYHNMDRERKRIGPEYVDVNDWSSMVKLFVQVASDLGSFDPGLGALKARIAKRFERRKALLDQAGS